MNLGRKHLSLLAWALALAIGLGAVGCTRDDADTTPTPELAGPRAVVERFFHWYVSERNLGREPMATDSLQSNADVAPDLVAAMESIVAEGRDPMLCSGEIPHAFTVGDASITGQAARVAVGSNASVAAWRVDLQQHNSFWRITAIDCAVE